MRGFFLAALLASTLRATPASAVDSSPGPSPTPTTKSAVETKTVSTINAMQDSVKSCVCGLASPGPSPGTADTNPTEFKDCPLPDDLDDGKTQCVCDYFKRLKSKDSNFNSGQLGEYCQAFETSSAAHGIEIALLVLDSASAITCGMACAILPPENAAWDARCNCASFWEGAVSSSWEMYLYAKSQEYGSGTALQILMGPVLGSLGMAMNLSSAPACTKLRGP